MIVRMRSAGFLAAVFLVAPLASWANSAPVYGDTYVSQANPTLNFGTLTTMSVGPGNTPPVGSFRAERVGIDGREYSEGHAHRVRE